MADDTGSQNISPEAEARKTIQQLQAQLEQANSTIKQLGAKEIATDWFRAKGAPDPSALAGIALPHLADKDPDGMRETLEQQFAALIPQAPSTLTGETGGDTPPTATGTRDPGTPGFPVPSPAGDGKQVVRQPEIMSRSEMLAKLRKGEITPQEAYEAGKAGSVTDLYQDPMARKGA